MSPKDLVDHLEFSWGWFGPPDGDVDRPSRWKSSLVSSAMVKDLLGFKTWLVARVELPAVSFPLQGWFADLAMAYKRFDKDHSQALWEATHRLMISKDQASTNTVLPPIITPGRSVEAGRLVLCGM